MPQGAPPVRETGAGNPPNISATTGLGTGGGALVMLSPFGEAWFDVEVIMGANPSSAGSFGIIFGATQQTMICGVPDGLGTVNVAQATNTIGVGWTGAAPVPRKRYRFHFQWATLT